MRHLLGISAYYHDSAAALLTDGERALAEASSGGISGVDFFYEHVHLTFNGNYVLARAIAERIERALTLSEGARWPDLAECAQRLGYTPRDTQPGPSDIRGPLADLPFTFQANHDEQMRRLAEAARGLPLPTSAAALREAQSAAEAALARWPDDSTLWEQLGEIKQEEGGGTQAHRYRRRSESRDDCGQDPLTTRASPEVLGVTLMIGVNDNVVFVECSGSQPMPKMTLSLTGT